MKAYPWVPYVSSSIAVITMIITDLTIPLYAQLNSNEAKSQVDKAMREVSLIMSELANLREIDVNSLDDLGKDYDNCPY